MYVLLFRKILPEGVRLRSVNQLGGRKAVVEACKRDQADDGRKKLYIIDGDFDHYHSRPRPRLKHLYRLRAYCVENILIHETAAVGVAAHADTNTAEDVVAIRLDFRQWISEITRKLGSLFVVYATAEALGAGVTTVSFPVQRLVESGRLSASKIRQRMLQVARGVCKRVGLRAYRLQRRIIQENAKTLRMTVESLISGKHYLLPLLQRRLQEMFRYRGSPDQLRTHLAENYNPNVEAWLRKRLLHVVAAM